MTENNINQSSPSSIGQKQSAVYLILLLIGLVVGTVGTFLFTRIFSDSSDPVVATMKGHKIKASEAFAGIRTRVYEIEDELYKIKLQAIQGALEDKLLKAEADRQNLPDTGALLNKEVSVDVAETTDQEVDAFLGAKGLTLEDPRIKKEDVMEYLKHLKKYELRQSYVKSLMDKSDTRIFLTEPEVPVITVNVEGYPTWGNPGAPVTIVEFSDFECPFCSRAVPALKQVKEVYGPDKVRIVFRDMPLPSHSKSVPAALAAHCAGDQGKFWEFHDLLFENQTALEEDNLKDYAKKLKLDEATFNECFGSKKHLALIEKSEREADSIGIQATPSFLINGVMISGAQPFDSFKDKIDRVLKK